MESDVWVVNTKEQPTGVWRSFSSQQGIPCQGNAGTRSEIMEQKSDTLNTETVATPAVPSSRSSGESRVSSHLLHDEGRFVPGTLLGGRYRIIELLGRGGMGEVYRATDLTLGQSVALKFLPEEAAANQRLLKRFHGEVRVARQVAHHNGR